MTYPADLEQKLGFDGIRQRLKGYCLSPYAHRLVDEMGFQTDGEAIRLHLQRNLEFRLILEKSEDFPTSHYHDPLPWLERMTPEGSYLEAEELLDLSYALDTALLCKAFLARTKMFYPFLFQLSEPVSLDKRLPRDIQSQLDERGLVKDTASAELGRIRRRLREEAGRLRKISEQLYRRAVEQKWVPEGALPTLREGRFVIPLLAEHKRKVKGFILDESATGQTVFLEPTEMLEANNELRDLEHAERREVIRILRAMTAVLRQALPELKVAFDFMQQVDFIRAKARFSVEIQAEMPAVADHPQLALVTARHPLLLLSLTGKREVVPLDLELAEGHRMILVSGPNAGGKSVCLKTVGLLQYMLQCGMLIPAGEKSAMGIFDDIFLDIGDQQSIENDLSTYSSHLRNMGVFLSQAGSGSLVLMDELGAGTDPDFGGAIAEAVLQSLLDKGVWGVATTHYHNLKLFAGTHPGIRNAAMRFDQDNLRPLYRLEIGKPGSSFALEIARKTGLPGETLAEAERLVGKELAGFESLVRKVEKERVELDEKIRQVEQREREVAHMQEQYLALSGELERRKKEIIQKAREEASELLRDTNREIEKTIRHIRENKAEKKETGKVRQNLRVLTDKIKGPARPGAVVPAGEIRPGDRVRIIGQHGNGTVLQIKGKNAMVQFGEIKSMVALPKLERADARPADDPVVPRSTKSIDLIQKRTAFQSTLDLRGKRVEETAPLVDQFIDTAILLGQSELRILHGKGEGILRKVVRDQLKRYKAVASFADEHVERGGDGITVVVLK